MTTSDVSSPTEGVLANANSEYDAYTKQASTVLRTLLIAAVGIVWLFAGALTSQPDSPQATFALVAKSISLSLALWFAIAGLTLDVLQYVAGSVAWGIYRWTWREILHNDDYELSSGEASKSVHWAWRLARSMKITQQIQSYRSRERPQPNVNEQKGFDGASADARKALELGESKEAVSSDWSPPFINRLTGTLFFLKLICGLATYICLLVAVTG